MKLTINHTVSMRIDASIVTYGVGFIVVEDISTCLNIEISLLVS